MPIPGMVMAMAILLVFSGICWAGVYKYVDSQGITHYTDNILEIPVDKRPPLEEEPLVDTAKRDDSGATANASAEEKPSKGKLVASAETVAAENGRQLADKGHLDELEAKRKRLDSEYDAIMLEQQRLNGMRNSLKTAREKKIFAEAADRLDARIKAYEEQRRTVSAQIRQYNDKIRKFEEKRKALEAEIAAYSSTGSGN
jgi:chromosome segregation ATPase